MSRARGWLYFDLAPLAGSRGWRAGWRRLPRRGGGCLGVAAAASASAICARTLAGSRLAACSRVARIRTAAWGSWSPGGERVLFADDGCGSGGGNAGVVVVTAGAIGAAELAVVAAVLGGQGLAAARTLADRGRVIGAGGRRLVIGCLSVQAPKVSFIFISDQRRNENKSPGAGFASGGQEPGGMPTKAPSRAWYSQLTVSERAPTRPSSV